MRVFIFILFVITFSLSIGDKTHAAGLEAHLSVTSAWSTGYCAQVIIENTDAVAYDSWTVNFDALPTFTSYWNAQRGSGNSLIAVSWNGSLAPGANTSLGFCASGTARPEVNVTGIRISAPTTPPAQPAPEPPNSSNPEPTPVPIPPPAPEPTPPPSTTPTEPPMSGPIAEFWWTVTSNWGTGYCAEGRMQNLSGEILSAWAGIIPLTGITSIWNARYQNGSVLPDAWNSIIYANGRATFGLCASGTPITPASARLLAVGYDEIIPVRVGTPPTPPSNPNPISAPPPPASSIPLVLPSPADIVVPNEFLLGTNINAFNWGSTQNFIVPNKQWAMAVAHAAALAHSKGLDTRYDLNSFFATAIKESNLGRRYAYNCVPSGIPGDDTFPNNDGCFQIESGTAFTELQRMYPQIFSSLTHRNTITTSFIRSALTKAYYDVFTVRIFDRFGFRAEEFIAQSRDPHILGKIISLAYNRGHWFEEFDDLFVYNRADCITYMDILSGANSPRCITHEGAIDHSYAIVDIATRLRNAPQYGGAYYDPTISWAEMEAYIDEIAPMNPGIDIANLRTATRMTFDSIAHGAPISFRRDFPTVLRTLLEHTWEIPEPGVEAYAARTF